MASDRAMEVHGARKDGYRGAEGKVVTLPHRGPVETTITLNFKEMELITKERAEEGF